MKKIISFFLLLCMVLPVAAYASEGSALPEITMQEVYDAGKNLVTLLGDHDNVYIRVTSEDGELLWEEYLDKEYDYTFYDGDYMNFGTDNAALITDHAEYYYSEGAYMLWVSLRPSGMVDVKEDFASAGQGSFISSEMLNDTYVVTEENGSIIVTRFSDAEEIAMIGDGVVSCEETYTLDAKTREMTSIKTVYTYEDGTTDGGISTITRDVEIPEGMKPFIAYEQATDLRTVTIVSNPGTENEKIESIQVPVGLQIGVSPVWDIEENFTTYADAACTQGFDGEWDVHSDLTIYVKWDE